MTSGHRENVAISHGGTDGEMEKRTRFVAAGGAYKVEGEAGDVDAPRSSKTSRSSDGTPTRSRGNRRKSSTSGNLARRMRAIDERLNKMNLDWHEAIERPVVPRTAKSCYLSDLGTTSPPDSASAGPADDSDFAHVESDPPSLADWLPVWSAPGHKRAPGPGRSAAGRPSDPGLPSTPKAARRVVAFPGSGDGAGPLIAALPPRPTPTRNAEELSFLERMVRAIGCCDTRLKSPPQSDVETTPKPIYDPAFELKDVRGRRTRARASTTARLARQVGVPKSGLSVSLRDGAFAGFLAEGDPSSSPHRTSPTERAPSPFPPPRVRSRRRKEASLLLPPGARSAKLVDVEASTSSVGVS